MRANQKFQVETTFIFDIVTGTFFGRLTWSLHFALALSFFARGPLSRKEETRGQKMMLMGCSLLTFSPYMNKRGKTEKNSPICCFDAIVMWKKKLQKKFLFTKFISLAFLPTDGLLLLLEILPPSQEEKPCPLCDEPFLWAFRPDRWKCIVQKMSRGS